MRDGVHRYLVKIRGTQSVDVFTSNERYPYEQEVLVSSKRGIEVGRVVRSISEFNPIGSIERLANEVDIETYWNNIHQASMDKLLCIELIQKHQLPMHVVSVTYNLDRSCVFIEYMSKERVDFRDLLRDLSRKLKTRIEFRQLGVRDCAKLIEVMGVCGRKACCSHLSVFKSVTMGMAKNQMIPINNDALSGTCGKLKCCLAFENDMYTECMSRFPKLHSTVLYQNKEYKVSDINACMDHMVLTRSNESIQVTLEDYEGGENYDKTTEF